MTTPKRRIRYLINPISGTQRKQGIEQIVRDETDRSRYEPDVVYTRYAGHGAELAAEAAREGCDIVVAVGGDGTVNEVGRALVETDTALGIIPCGSGNGLARHLCLPLDPHRAVAILNEGVIHRLDYGVINDHPFFCTCGVGFDAFISERFAEAGRRGLLTYIENTLRLGLQYKPETYLIETPAEQTACKAFLIACANASQYGNDARIAPLASMKDGLLDVVVMEPFNAIEAPQVALQLFNGTLPANSHVKTFRTSSLRITRLGEGVAHYDGDPFWTGQTIDVSLRRHGLSVVVNAHKPQTAERRQPLGLLTALPTFFGEWRRLPETLIDRTGRDLRRIVGVGLGNKGAREGK